MSANEGNPIADQKDKHHAETHSPEVEEAPPIADDEEEEG